MSPVRKGTPDFLLLLMTMAIIAFGLLMVYSASSMTATLHYHGDSFYFLKKQAAAMILGLIAMFIFMNVPYQQLKKRAGFLYFIVFILLVLVLIPHIGTSIHGARSWFNLHSFSLQPAELGKLTIVIYLAALISKKGAAFHEFKKGLLPSLVLVGFYCGLIMLQPDLGSCIILALCAALVILVGGANLRHFFSLGFGASLLAAFIFLGIPLMTNSSNYKTGRISTFLHPWAHPLKEGYQITQSLMAFGHGGFGGTGLGQSVQKLGFLPFQYNDFIFAIIGEELGFIGVALFLIFYILFLWRGILISLRCPDPFGSLMGTGIVGMIGVQALINIGGVTNSIPLTGVTLPFISYGGSSLLVMMASMGILLGISREQNLPETAKMTKKMP